MDANIDAVIVDSLPDGIRHVSENFEFLRWNKVAEETTGRGARILAEDAVDSAIRRAGELMYRSKTNDKGRYSVG
jgi:PAS domain-containing protein